MLEEETLLNYYHKLYSAFGPQHWWPGENPFEIAVGAILTQNTSWKNVEKAIHSLKSKGLLSPDGIRLLSLAELAALIRSAGYFNLKAKRLKAFIEFLFSEYAGSLNGMFEEELFNLREKLLGVKGIGPETADSILLYAGEYPTFVVDVYTCRVLDRHNLMPFEPSYDEVQNLFARHLPEDASLFNEYHALFVKVGKEFCRKSTPLCEACPLREFL